MGIEEEIKGALLVAGGVGTVFLVSELLYHLGRLEAEKTRKIAHFGSGLTVLALPWLLRSAWTVLLLSCGFVLLLAGTRRAGLLPSVHAVPRRSRGAHYYPLSILVVFLISQGDPLLYLVPILILALCDPAAALVGQELGTFSYRVEADSSRTVEGSATFFALAYLISLVGLGLAGPEDLTFPSLLLVPLCVAVVATGVEAICTGGADNLFVPYAALLVLRLTLDASPAELGRWTEAMAAMLLLGLVSYRRARLAASGFISLFLIGTLSWCVGGLAWLLPLLMVYSVFLASRSRGMARPEGLTTQAIFPVTACGLASLALELHFGLAFAFPLYLVSVSGNSAIAWLLHFEHRALSQGGAATVAGGAAAMACGTASVAGGAAAVAGGAAAVAGRTASVAVRPLSVVLLQAAGVLAGAALPLVPVPLAALASGRAAPSGPLLAIVLAAGSAAPAVFVAVRRCTGGERRARVIAVALLMLLLAGLEAGGLLPGGDS